MLGPHQTHTWPLSCCASVSSKQSFGNRHRRLLHTHPSWDLPLNLSIQAVTFTVSNSSSRRGKRGILWLCALPLLTVSARRSNDDEQETAVQIRLVVRGSSKAPAWVFWFCFLELSASDLGKWVKHKKAEDKASATWSPVVSGSILSCFILSVLWSLQWSRLSHRKLAASFTLLSTAEMLVCYQKLFLKSIILPSHT